MLKKVFVFLLVQFIAFYPVLVPLANASVGTVSTVQDVDTNSLVQKDVDEATKIRVQQTFGKLPLYFIQNNGQTDERVKFYEKGSGHTTYFTKEGVCFSLIKNQEPSVKNEIASGLKPFAMTPLTTHDSRLTTHDSIKPASNN